MGYIYTYTCAYIKYIYTFLYFYLCITIYFYICTYICIYAYIFEQIHFKELANTIVGTGKFEIHRADSSLETQDKVNVAVNALYN
jgi:hypothetical protein